MSEPTPCLTDTERDRLADLEAVVERGRQTFVEVGQALLAIREERLYRAEHASFEAYCRARWSMGRAHGYRMIEAAQVAEALSPVGDAGLPLPRNEAQVRELAPLRSDPPALRRTWAKVLEKSGGKPTAKLVHDQVRSAVVTVGYTGNNDVLVAGAAALYIHDGDRVADTTWGAGSFWRTVETSRFTLLASDIEPRFPHVKRLDFRHLPYDDGEIDVLVLDPPFSHHPGSNWVAAHQYAGATAHGMDHRRVNGGAVPPGHEGSPSGARA